MLDIGVAMGSYPQSQNNKEIRCPETSLFPFLTPALCSGNQCLAITIKHFHFLEFYVSGILLFILTLSAFTQSNCFYIIM